DVRSALDAFNSAPAYSDWCRREALPFKLLAYLAPIHEAVNARESPDPAVDIVSGDRRPRQKPPVDRGSSMYNVGLPGDSAVSRAVAAECSALPMRPPKCGKTIGRFWPSCSPVGRLGCWLMARSARQSAKGSTSFRFLTFTARRTRWTSTATRLWCWRFW